MNLRRYYQQVREVEASLPDDDIVVRSKTTEAGGRAGKLTEVSRPVAAKLLTQDVVELVSPKDANSFRKARNELASKLRKERASQQIQFAVLSRADLSRVPGLGEELNANDPTD